MNIIEQVWTYMEKEKVKRAPVNMQQLWEVLQDIWRNIPVDFIQKLYDSFPRRVNEVCKAKGFHTKYWICYLPICWNNTIKFVELQ